jgi:hypothetical protein
MIIKCHYPNFLVLKNYRVIQQITTYSLLKISAEIFSLDSLRIKPADLIQGMTRSKSC